MCRTCCATSATGGKAPLRRRDDRRAGHRPAGGAQGTGGLAQGRAGGHDVVDDRLRRARARAGPRPATPSARLAARAVDVEPGRVAHSAHQPQCVAGRRPRGQQPRDVVAAARPPRGGGRRHGDEDRVRLVKAVDRRRAAAPAAAGEIAPAALLVGEQCGAHRAVVGGRCASPADRPPRPTSDAARHTSAHNAVPRSPAAHAVTRQDEVEQVSGEQRTSAHRARPTRAPGVASATAVDNRYSR